MESRPTRSELKRIASTAVALAVLATGGLLTATVADSQSQAPPARPAGDLAPQHRCARCHLNDMLEWGTSRHSSAGTTCISCHGASEGHVIDERNNIKPDRLPRGEAIAASCRQCHDQGCPNTKRTDGCQSCHHVHALVDLTKSSARSSGLERIEQERQRYYQAVERGDSLVAKADWSGAFKQYEAALAIRAGDARAKERMAFCRRRLNPEMPGFRILSDAFDPETGLPVSVEAPALGMKMVLIPGGATDIGDAELPDARLVHTVRVESFYLAECEVTQGQWAGIMGTNPSAYQDGFAEHLRMPVDSVSWEDCRRFIEKVNQRTPGSGFRLPTEAEWEYALRKGGESHAGLDAVAWYRDNSQFKNRGRTDEPPQFSSPHPAGAKGANLLGLRDLQGNVWEWCSSLFLPYPYDAADGREDAAREGLRVLRGGSFTDRADLLTPGLRYGERPDRRFRWNGLRLARSVPASSP